MTVRVDPGDSRPVTFTVTAAEGSGSLLAASVVVDVLEVDVAGAVPVVLTHEVVSETASELVVSAVVSWPVSARDGAYLVRCRVSTSEGVPVEAGGTWFYVVAWS